MILATRAAVCAAVFGLGTNSGGIGDLGTLILAAIIAFCRDRARYETDGLVAGPDLNVGSQAFPIGNGRSPQFGIEIRSNLLGLMGPERGNDG